MRIARACIRLGLDFVCLFTKEDAQSGHLDLAREKGGDKALYRVSSYHDANEVLSVADEAEATAIHPGYGFFAEDFRFAKRVVKRNRPLIWIGPGWRVIRELGDKINTKRLARGLDVPTVPGSDRPVYDEMEAEQIASNLFAFQAEQGFDQHVVLLKASAGGGGMGIEEVDSLDLFRSTFRRLRNYAKRTFQDSGVLIEQRIFDYNHLEVQVLGDLAGDNHVHFGTRNCSVQSTGRQKRIEVAPGFAPEEWGYTFDAHKVLDDITEYSLRMAREVRYNSVGTWEWIVTPKGAPFLMEVNTRIQVENGISGMISSINGEGPVDLIAEQIRTALGQPLGYSQDSVTFDGLSIEYRLIAEDPANKFSPWAGSVERFEWKKHPWLTMYTQVPSGRAYDIPTEYDPNLALAIVKGKDLTEAKARGLEFLDSLVLEGRDKSGGALRSNIEFLREQTAHLLEF